MNKSITDINKLISENKNIDKELSRELSIEKIINLFIERKNLILKLFLLVFSSISIHTIYMRAFNPTFLGKFTLLISDPLRKSGVNYTPLDPKPIENTALGDTRNDIPTLITFLKSSYVLSPVSEKFNIDTKEIQKRLKINSSKISKNNQNEDNTGILNIEYLSKSPTKDLKFLTSLSKQFINSAKLFKKSRLEDGLQFLESQEPELQEKVDNIQNKIKKFREKYSIIEPLQEGLNLKNQENNYLEKIRQLDKNHENLINIREGINNDQFFITGFKQNISTRDGNQSPGQVTGLDLSTNYQSLLEEFNKVENELSLLRSTFKPSSKVIKAFEQRSNGIKPILKKYQLDAVNAAISFNRTQRGNLEKQREAINKQFKEKPLLISEYESLLGNLSIVKQNFSSLIRAKEEFQLEIARDSISWKIIEQPSFDDYPLYPAISRRLISAFFIGIIVSYFVAFYQESKVKTFKNIKEIKDRFPIFKFLGTIPFNNNFNNSNEESNLLYFFQKEYNFQQNSQFSKEENIILKEKMRNIFSSIKSLSKSNKKLFLITSSQPGEGKSIISALLALTFCEMGKKVLLIEADLRKPKLDNYFALQESNGISNFIESKSNNYEDFIQSIKKTDNLYYISRGSASNNPTKILSSKKFEDLLLNLKESKEFDYVFINSTPILGVSDASLIANKVDEVIMILSPRLTTKDLAYEAIRNLILESDQEPKFIINLISKEISTKDLDEGSSINYYI